MNHPRPWEIKPAAAGYWRIVDAEGVMVLGLPPKTKAIGEFLIENIAAIDEEEFTRLMEASDDLPRNPAG